MRLMVDLTAGELLGDVNGKEIQEASDELMSVHHESCRRILRASCCRFRKLDLLGTAADTSMTKWRPKRVEYMQFFALEHHHPNLVFATLYRL